MSGLSTTRLRTRRASRPTTATTAHFLHSLHSYNSSGKMEDPILRQDNNDGDDAAGRSSAEDDRQRRRQVLAEEEMERLMMAQEEEEEEDYDDQNLGVNEDDDDFDDQDNGDGGDENAGNNDGIGFLPHQLPAPAPRGGFAGDGNGAGFSPPQRQLSYIQASFGAALGLVYYAYRSRQQWYLAIIFLTSSKWAYIVMGNSLVASLVWTFKLFTIFFLDGLRLSEVEGIAGT